MDRKRPLLRVVALCAAAGAMLTACGEPEDADSADGQRQAEPTSESSAAESTSRAPTSTTTSSPRPTTTTTQQSTPSPTSPQRRQEDRLCAAADLELSLGDGNAGAGTAWRPLRFTNVGDETCVVHGFPGVSYVAGNDGHQVGAAAYREGTKGDPVTLRTGQTAHAPIGFVQVRNYDASECEPTKTRGLRVYPPQETNSMYVANAGEGCANENTSDAHLKVRTIEPGGG